MGMLFARLDEQWATLAHDRRLNEATRDILALAGDASDWVEAQVWMRSPAVHAADKNGVLTALVLRARGDERVAATCLSLLMPGIVSEVGRHYRRPNHGDRKAETEAAAIEIAWRLIRTYPKDRHGNVAANVLLDLRKQLSLRSKPITEELMEPSQIPVGDGPPPTDWTGDLVELVDQARRLRWLSTEEAEAILDTRVRGERRRDAAARRSMPERSFRRLLRVAETHLTEFARQELAA